MRNFAIHTNSDLSICQLEESDLPTTRSRQANVEVIGEAEGVGLLPAPHVDRRRQTAGSSRTARPEPDRLSPSLVGDRSVVVGVVIGRVPWIDFTESRDYDRISPNCPNPSLTGRLAEQAPRGRPHLWR